MGFNQIIYYSIYTWSPCDLFIASTDKGLCQLRFLLHENEQQIITSLENNFKAQLIKNKKHFKKIFSDLDRYFQGERIHFDLPIDYIQGTPFQQRVWNQLRLIPWGETSTYGQLATRLENPRAVRAVGSANGANPIPVIIPCHRVVQSNGRLGGYSGGLHIKDILLRLEGAIF